MYEVMRQRDGLFQKRFNYLPSAEELRELAAPFKNSGGSFCLIDDFGNDLKRSTGELFNVVAKHNKIVICLLVQNLFLNNPVFREISLNASYIIVFKMIRDKKQIMSLAKQYAPAQAKAVAEMFYLMTTRPYR